MPAEWEPHAATWLAWPHEEQDWPGKLAPIPWVYGEFVRHLASSERVRILVGTAAREQQARKLLARLDFDHSKVDFVRAATDRVWTRDSCPQVIKNKKGERALVGFKFNGWAKYKNHKRDQKLPEVVSDHLRLKLWVARLRDRQVVLEGGSIDVNGKGTLLTTEECLLSKIQERNPGAKRGEYEDIFAQMLGARHTIWLGDGIAGDDTHGHVDDLARFVDARTVALAVERDPADANHKPTMDNLKRLKKAKDQDGRALTVLELPMPKPVVLDGQRLPASYANFYIANSCVLVPTFNDPADRVALERLAQVFKKRKVIGIHCVDMVWGLGTLHCASQQEPA
ncbi:MAG: agmatine deiminase family protein [Deltaproteobacteria bacterium]|nr:agmatine deiminase family protein [Deltaproteobacteria bacterium]